MLNKELLQYTADRDQVPSFTLTETTSLPPRLCLVPRPIHDQIAMVLVEQPPNIWATTSSWKQRHSWEDQQKLKLIHCDTLQSWTYKTLVHNDKWISLDKIIWNVVCWITYEVLEKERRVWFLSGRTGNLWQNNTYRTHTNCYMIIKTPNCWQMYKSRSLCSLRFGSLDVS